MSEFELVDAYTQLSLRGRSEYERGLKSLEGKLRNIQSHMDAVGRRARWALLGMGAAVAGSVKLFASAEESANRFRAVFAEQAEQVDKFASELAGRFDRDKVQIQDAMSAYQSLFLGLEFGQEEAAGLSKAMQLLAMDFASFTERSDTEAMERFIAFMSGSTEVLDQWGINAKEAALKQKLLDMGFEGSAQKASEQEKALARVQILFETMVRQDSVGDLARTHLSLSNQMKSLLAVALTTTRTLGEAFAVSAGIAVYALKDLLTLLRELTDENAKSIVRLVGVAGGLLLLLAIAPQLVAAIQLLITAYRGLATAAIFLAGAHGLGGQAGLLLVMFKLIAALTIVAALTIGVKKAFEKLQEGIDKAKEKLGDYEKEAAAHFEEQQKQIMEQVTAAIDAATKSIAAKREVLAVEEEHNAILKERNDLLEKAEGHLQDLADSVEMFDLTSAEKSIAKIVRDLQAAGLVAIAEGFEAEALRLADLLDAKERWKELREEHAGLLKQRPKWTLGRPQFEMLSAASLQARVQASISQAEDKRLEYEKESRDHLKNIEKIEGEMLEVGKKIFKKDPPEARFI